MYTTMTPHRYQFSLWCSSNYFTSTFCWTDWIPTRNSTQVLAIANGNSTWP